jgi:hypothetical protein
VSRKSKTKRPKPADRPEPIPVLNLDAAGMDIGATEIYVAVPTDRDREPIQCFGTFTVELVRLAEWLKQCRIKDRGYGGHRRLLDSGVSASGKLRF